MDLLYTITAFNLFFTIIFSISRNWGNRVVKKELMIYTILLCVLALGMHMSEWVSHPIEHFKDLAHHPMPYHPLLYAFIIYLVLAALRGMFHVLKKILFRN